MPYIPSSSGGGGSSTPGGSDTSVQYNNAGSLGGNTNFTYDATNNKLVIKDTTTQSQNSFQLQDSGGNREYAWGPGGSIYVANRKTHVISTLNLTKTDAAYQFLDPSGTLRNINLPATSASDAGLAFCIYNSASSGTGVFAILNTGGTQIGPTIPYGASLNVIWDGSRWRYI